MVDLYKKRFKCNKCGGRASLAKYDDGMYCFRCGYDTRRENKQNKVARVYKSVIEEYEFEVYDLPVEYNTYLASFGIYPDNLYYNNLKYTNMYGGRLLITVPGIDNQPVLCLFKDIYYNNSSTLPKVINRGHRPCVFFTRTGFKYRFISTKSNLVIVEDPFSAIRLSQVCTTLCLFGTALSAENFRNLIKFDFNAIIWLDDDSAGHSGAEKLTKRLSPYVNVKTIFTEKDPKFYSDCEIREFYYNMSTNK
jgi:ribosomal protein S27AE